MVIDKQRNINLTYNKKYDYYEDIKKNIYYKDYDTMLFYLYDKDLELYFDYKGNPFTYNNKSIFILL